MRPRLKCSRTPSQVNGNLILHLLRYVIEKLILQYVDAVGLAWGADTMPLEQKHDHHGRRIL